MMKRQHPFSITNRPNTATTKKNSFHNTLGSGIKKITIDVRDVNTDDNPNL